MWKFIFPKQEAFSWIHARLLYEIKSCDLQTA